MKAYKQALRAEIRMQKRSLTEDDILRRSAALCRQVLESEAYRSAKSVYGYLPFNQEVRTLPLLEQALADGKQVALPKCFGSQMRFILVTDLSQVQKSANGAPEPIADTPVADDPRALVLVPGIAFDTKGFRIGYGGGYYDRFLAAEPQHPTIALCYDFQLLPGLKTDPHDIAVDTVFCV